jgi:hypothetical protein
MRNLKWVILFCILGYFSCSTNSNQELGIEGNWFTRQPGQNYFELYIKENRIVMNHEVYGMMEYSFLRKDSVLYVTNEAFERVWVLESLEGDFFKIRDQKDTIEFKRISLGVDFYEVYQDSSSLRQFVDDFNLRVKLRP